MLRECHTEAKQAIMLPANIISDKSQTSNLARGASDVQVVVKNQEGTWKCYSVHSEMKVENLKDQLCATSQNTARNDFYLTCKGKVLEDNCVLADYNICQNQIIEMSHRTRGGTKDSYGNEFVDVSSENFDERKFTQGIVPPWRHAKVGLNLEGKCRNKECVAFSKDVVYKFGEEDFDLVLDRRRAKCPICSKKIITKSCYMVKCKYHISGIKITPSNKEEPVELDFQMVEEDYRHYDHVKIGTVNWKSLKVYVLGRDKEVYNASKACVRCFVSIFDEAKGYRFLNNCNRHRIHDSCYDKLDSEDKELCISCEKEKDDLNSQINTGDEMF